MEQKGCDENADVQLHECLEQFHVRWLHNRSGRATDVCCDGGHGDRILGAAAVIAKLQVLILLNANML